MKKLVVVLLGLCLVFALAACTQPTTAPDTNPVAPTPTTPTTPTAPVTPDTPAVTEAFPGKIAIITNDVTQNEEEYRSAQQMVAKYGEEKVVHKIWPVKFPEEGEQMIRIVQQIAADPEVKALIINQCVQNSMAAVDKLLETRSDMFLVAIQPTENPPDIAKRFNLILNADEIMMGDAMPIQAQKMGAKTFVHLSFPRHMSYALISARYGMLKENCEKLGMDFVTYTVPDPTGDIGMAGAQQVMLEEIPKLVAQYGEDTAFFCTNCGLQVPLIKATVDAHGIYVQPCCPSPFHGFPLALGLVSGTFGKVAEGEEVDEQSVFDAVGTENTIQKIVAQTIEKLSEKNMLGRVSTWPVPVAMMNTVASAEYAIKWINGEVPKDGIDKDALEQCMFDYTGVKCNIRTLGTHPIDADVADGAYPNWFFVMMDYLTYE
ncbi:MAG: DUF3798 domain-containing protein [Firmicutes bacterium]|nr:DUF3798 domain-containing protein [Bacillota bacterium]